MASAGYFIVALILMLIIISMVVYAISKFVDRDSFWYDSEFVWRRNLQKEGTAPVSMDKDKNHSDQ
ncbi:hypothetical protein [Ferviditalea candida]|uniref:Uncharacterized protein n=1 Tax=Ferviditalea candida TaxID=3108399 RepID=A0ABU5ZCR5_9BACL|nr:hypothetical protein [Paenibacillaceae bacterium T2]